MDLKAEGHIFTVHLSSPLKVTVHIRHISTGNYSPRINRQLLPQAEQPLRTPKQSPW